VATAGYQYFNEDESDSFIFALGMELPIFNRHTAELNAAKEEMDAILSERAQAKVDQATSRQRISSELAVAHQTVIVYRKDVIPAMQEAYDVAVEGYAKGKFDYLAMLDAQRELVDAEEILLAALAEYHRLAAELQATLGKNPITKHTNHQGDN
jgi:cobalt-zinc-cadmium efflux system outer membrane protein